MTPRIKRQKPDKAMSLKRILKYLITAIFILFLFYGCSIYRLPPPAVFDLTDIDTTPLRGKIIVIDPGHGGKEKGATGTRGLKEAEVNIGVALHLWGLLKEAGAKPFLTRHTDSSVYKEKDFTLKKDLQARTDISNKLSADLFISIHHNASEKNKNINNLIIFYKTSDSGRSRDAARSILAPLKEKLVPENASIRQGNYHVLRKTNTAAILGEASFISSKANEKELSFQRTSMREAKGYFLGIVNYFSKGIPDITAAAPNNVTLKTAEPEMSAQIYPGNKTVSVSKKDITITVDNKKISSFKYNNGKVSFIPKKPLSNSSHLFCLAARNSKGNISKKKCVSFNISLVPEMIKATPRFLSLPADGTARNPIDIEVLDRLGRPVSDNTKIDLFASKGFFLKKSVFTKNGKARAIFISPATPRKATITATAGNISSETSIDCGRTKDSLFMATLRDTMSRPVIGTGLLKNKVSADLSDSEGFVYDKTEISENTCYEFKKKGYYSRTICPELKPGEITVKNLLLKAVDSGILINKKIILDPSGKDISTIPLLNDLKTRIENAGGNAILTWEQVPPPTDAKRIKLASKTDAAIFLSFENADNLSIGHYYRSEKGKRLADKICFQLSKIFKDENCKTEESRKHVVVHTPMPAVLITLPFLTDENTVSASLAVYRALLEFFSD